MSTSWIWTDAPCVSRAGANSVLPLPRLCFLRSAIVRGVVQGGLPAPQLLQAGQVTPLVSQVCRRLLCWLAELLLFAQPLIRPSSVLV